MFYLALGEPGDLDIVEEIEGIRFIISRDMYNVYRKFDIESIKKGSAVSISVKPGKHD